MEYHKINSVFKRDMEARGRPLIYGAWTAPEFEYLQHCKWELTEKVDGTNIRVIVADGKVTFGGRTDAAQLPAKLFERLTERFVPQTERLLEAFPEGAVLYGEGYGAGIQSAGKLYRQDQDFVLFDVLVGKWWLHRNQVESIAEDFGIDAVPRMGTYALYEAVELVARGGLKSTWGDFVAEGVVARPTVELYTRSGARIIAKIKAKDFQ